MITFSLSKKEEENLNEWISKYKLKGTISYNFTSTGIGTTIIVHHVDSGKTKNITDYENW